MITFESLYNENHKITELSNVFLYLIKERTMCDAGITCDVFFDYMTRINQHLDLVDKHLYTKLLASPEQPVRQRADRFMADSREIKKILNEYFSDWSDQRHLIIKNHDEFVKDTETVFGLVMDRIQRETEHLYPLVREANGNDVIAA
ncbi:MAG: hypothetical protein ACWA5Q_11585 [bacterium]